MKNNAIKIFTIIGTTTLFFACGNSEEQKAVEKETKEAPREQYVEQITAMEADLFKAESVDPEIANKAIKAYSDYALIFPKDTVSPHYLFKAGEVATANKQYHQALVFYENIEKNYPEFVHIESAIYLQAYIYDYLSNNDDKAKVVYERLIKLFPNSHYAKDAAAAINNLGKTDEQLIEEFKKKNGQK